MFSVDKKLVTRSPARDYFGVCVMHGVPVSVIVRPLDTAHKAIAVVHPRDVRMMFSLFG